MARHLRKPKIFYAIPCGDFYSIQRDIIERVSRLAGVDPIIVENHAQTKGLWEKIADQIESADFFVADISSHSPNIVVELGYAMREKSTRSIGIFISASASIPVDLQGFVLQKYESFANFQDKLIRWLCEALPLLDSARFKGLRTRYAAFREDFNSQETFLKLWSFPPGSAFILTPPEGLRFTSAHFPIMTTTLALLRDCEFEFRARIDKERFGWVVKGTKDPRHFLPAFCVMFNLDINGNLAPHIWNERNVHPKTHYHVFAEKKVNISKSKKNWFTLITRVRSDTIEIENEGNIVFSADFNKRPYAGVYEDFPNKEGQVGFRCHPGEEATINYVKVREI